jgi:hypothetical protein
MVLVSALAIALGGADLWRRREEYGRRARDFGAREARRHWEIKWLESRSDESSLIERAGWVVDEILERNRKAAGYLASMKQKYESLASRPWSLAPPDPVDPVYVQDAESGLR